MLITRRSQVQILPPLPTSSQVRGPFPLGGGLLRVWPLTRSVTSDASVVPLRHMLRRRFTGPGNGGGIDTSTQLPEGQGTDVLAVLAGGRSAFRCRARSRDRFHASQSSEPRSAEYRVAQSNCSSERRARAG